MASVSSPGLVNASSMTGHMGAMVDVVVDLERKYVIHASSFISEWHTGWNAPQRCKAVLLLAGYLGAAVRETAWYVAYLNEGGS